MIHDIWKLNTTKEGGEGEKEEKKRLGKNTSK